MTSVKLLHSTSIRFNEPLALRNTRTLGLPASIKLQPFIKPSVKLPPLFCTTAYTPIPLITSTHATETVLHGQRNYPIAPEYRYCS
ncbi:hypothetical protein DPMN_107160 [Dreissena polymorpha]|uniref:Uncharacterized protein n=1 Tax=Dreissena polymorpha TaxID=45954 RepID=A0A9D4K6H6_DREPO|nr:hypothetical protein DPMN_107160 [Dreissena polymorpha]